MLQFDAETARRIEATYTWPLSVAGWRGVTAVTARGWVDDLAALGEATFFSINRYLFRASVPGGS